MADKPYPNVVLLDNYRGRGPRGWKVWPNGNCKVIEASVRKDRRNRTLASRQAQKIKEAQP